MNPSIVKKLDTLRSDYAAVTGEPFRSFYCPILFRDDDAELCQAHLINTAFSGASRRWTIQRKDVDGFFGSVFESDFVDIQLRRAGPPEDILIDRKLSKRLRPKILRNGKKIEHYIPCGPIPPEHSQFMVNVGGKELPLALKIHPDDTLAASKCNWEIRIDGGDIRLAAMVSLLKAAHLALFEMLGYQYALSAGGYFLGHTVLGSFFRKNHGQPRTEIQKNAQAHFSEFVHMVRPVQSGGSESKGTADDGFLYICMRGTQIRWAFLVLIRTGESLHSVLVPIFEDKDLVSAKCFLTFLQDENEQIEAIPARFEGDRWSVAKKTRSLTWPKVDAVLL